METLGPPPSDDEDLDDLGPPPPEDFGDEDEDDLPPPDLPPPAFPGEEEEEEEEKEEEVIKVKEVAPDTAEIPVPPLSRQMPTTPSSGFFSVGSMLNMNEKMSCFPVSLAMMSHCNSESDLNARLAIQQIKESLRSGFQLSPEIALSLMCTSMNSAVFDFLALQIEHSKVFDEAELVFYLPQSYVVFERGVRAWCSSVVFERGVRARSARNFFSHYHSLILIEMHDRNARSNTHSNTHSNCYENLTRASRSNTGTGITF